MDIVGLREDIALAADIAGDIMLATFEAVSDVVAFVAAMLYENRDLIWDVLRILATLCGFLLCFAVGMASGCDDGAWEEERQHQTW